MFEGQGYRGETKIRDLERNGDRPFGHVSNKGRFQFNIEKVPFYNIPDLTGFKVRADTLISSIAEALRASHHSEDQR